MTNKERMEMRRLQDRLLSHPITMAFTKQYGTKEPLFGDGTPCFQSLACYVYPEYKERIESFLSNNR